MNILEQYKQQLENDKKNQNDMFPEDSKLTEEQRSEYVKKLNELRNDPNDMEAQYEKRMQAMENLSESDLVESNCIKQEDVKSVIKHAYCPNCGEELISRTPPMLNPFTFEKICKHECTKCKKIYNLEHAYPRVAYINNNGEEISAFGR